MRFQRVTFRCFGPFEDQTLDLSERGHIQVVFGPNEAGKSCALRGLIAFLFGFPGQSTDDFRFKYNQFRIHALLEKSKVENGEVTRLECIRRKGNKDTLRKICDKEVVPDRQLTEFLGGMDRTQFEQLFGLDAERLRQGGEEIVQQKEGNQLAAALFAAGAGMKGLQKLSQGLEDRQHNLYLPGGRKQEITEALRQFRELEKQARDLILLPDKYAEAYDTAAHTRARVAELSHERVEVRTQRDLLNRYRSALPTIDLLKIARERLAAVADAPLLSADFNSKLEKAREKLATAKSEIDFLESEHKKLTGILEAEQPITAILNEENEIGELKKLVGADAKAREEEVKAATFSVDERGKARDIYRELTGNTNWDQMDGLKPRLDERTRITQLANERSGVIEDVNRQEKAVRDASRLLTEAKNKQKEISEPPDPSSWQEAVDHVAAAGPVENQLQKLAKAVETEESRLADEFARFHPTPPGNWQDAPAQTVPMAELIETFRQDFESVQARIAKFAEQAKETEGKLAAIRESLIEKVGSESVPTESELLAARRDRDGGLHCIRLRLAGKAETGSEADFTNRHAPGRSLIDAAESSVRHCDTLSDRLRHEADRVATFQSIQQQLKTHHDRLARLTVEAEEAKATLAEVDKRWRAAWQPPGILPLNPKVMQVWLSNWSKFCERVSDCKDGRRDCEELKGKIAELRAQLSNACSAAQSGKTLVEDLALARKAIADATTARSNSKNLVAEIKRLQAALETAEQELEKAKARRADWERQWAEAVAVLRLKETAPSIETAQGYLNRIDQMQQHLKDMRLKDARVREIKSERARLIERISALRQRIDPTAVATTAESLDADFRSVENALREAIDRRTRRQEYSRQLADVEKKRSRARTNLTEATTTLASLAAEAGVASADEIPAAVQRARERADAALLVRQYEEALAQNALGESMETFVAAALAHRDDLNNQVVEFGLKVDQLDSEVSEAEAVARAAEQKLESYRQASDAAAAAHQESALLASRIKDLVIEYAALHLARTVLDRAKENYRKRNQDTMLDRAGASFKTLTRDAFSGLDIENEDGTDVLKAVRTASNRPDSRVPVSGLSDGTRDQLFLALRLAGIKQHLEERGPVPLIIDDVLISFDDDRAKATLKCLAEFAKGTQVIVFTHHQHLVELARAVDSSTAVCELVPYS